MSKKRRIRIVLGFLLICIIGGAYYWWIEHLYPSTENAYVGGDILRVAPLVSGKVEGIYILNDQYVRAGQPLLQIDPEPFDFALAEARTGFDSAEELAGDDGDTARNIVKQIDDAMAALNDSMGAFSFAAQRYNSVANLPGGSETALEDLDEKLQDVKNALRDLDTRLEDLDAVRKNIGGKGAAKIKLRSSIIQLQRALMERRRTLVVADKSGWITKLALRPGTIIQSGQPLFALVEDSDRWIEANFKETDIQRLKIGQPVEIEVDIYPDMTLNGRIESFSGGSGATFSALPAENATGNWVKVTQRFPVRISIDDFPYSKDRPLRIGASAKVTVDTSGADEE